MCAEDLSDGEEVFPKEIAKWNSNDLMDKIEAADTEDAPGRTLRSTHWEQQLSPVPARPTICLCLCLFLLGELFQEMSVDYDRGTSEERMDEVGFTHTIYSGRVSCWEMSEKTDTVYFLFIYSSKMSASVLFKGVESVMAKSSLDSSSKCRQGFKSKTIQPHYLSITTVPKICLMI